jgi:hypothetical protein
MTIKREDIHPGLWIFRMSRPAAGFHLFIPAKFCATSSWPP